MSIKVVCGGCQRELRMAPRALGQQVRCPACGLTFMAGQPESAVVADPVPPAPAAAPPTEPVPEPLIFSKAPQRPEPGTGWWLPLLALVPLGIAGLGHGDTAPVLVAVTLTAGCLVLALARTLSRRTRPLAILGLGAPGYLVLPLAPLFETPAPPEAAWAESVPAGARCRLEFPGRPSREERRFHRGARRVEVHVVEQSRPYRLFLFSHHPEKDEPGVLPLDLMAWKMADSVCRDLRDAWPGPRTPHEVSGFPGRQVVIDQAGKGSLTLRVYLIHSTVYLLAAGGEGLRPDSPEVRRFFDSFRPDLTPPEPPGPTAEELRPRAGDRLPEVAVLHWPELNWPDCVALSPDGKYLAVGMTGGRSPSAARLGRPGPQGVVERPGRPGPTRQRKTARLLTRRP